MKVLLWRSERLAHRIIQEGLEVLDAVLNLVEALGADLIAAVRGITFSQSDHEVGTGMNSLATDEIEPSTSPTEPSRRKFMKGAIVASAAFALEGGGLLNLARWQGLPRAQVAEAVIFPDPSLCIGCLTCEVICSRVHREQGLSDIPRIRIYNDPGIELHPEIEKNYPGRGRFRQQPCLQCPTAECLYVCPVNAFQVEPTSGARIILEDVCVSCGRCANACPYPTYDESLATNQELLGQFSRITYDPELDTYTKCDLCYWRPEGPACVERCPINIRIWQGIVKSDTLCLDMPRADQATWERLRAFQTFPSSPAPPVEIEAS